MKDELSDTRPKDGLLAHNRHKNRDLDILPSKYFLEMVSRRVRDSLKYLAQIKQNYIYLYIYIYIYRGFQIMKIDHVCPEK